MAGTIIKKQRVAAQLSPRTHRLLTVTAVLFSLLFVLQLVEFFHFRADQNRIAAQIAQRTSLELSTQIQDLLGRVEDEADELAERLSQMNNKDEVVAALRESALSVPEIRGATACYEPNAFGTDKRLYCPYYFKVTGEIIDVADSYDYTEPGPGTRWYTDVMAEGAGWTSPYFGAGGQEYYVDYGTPIPPSPAFGGLDGTPGIVDLSIEVGDFQSIIHNLTIGRTSQTYIVSDENVFVSHPDVSAVGERELLDLLAENDHPPAFQAAVRNLANGESGSTQFRDPVNQDTVYVHYERLPGSGFGLLSLSYQSDLVDDQAKRNRRLINLTLLLAASLICIATRYFARDQLDAKEIVGLSVVTTLLMSGVILLIGGLQHSLEAGPDYEASVPITDTTTLARIIEGETGRSDLSDANNPTPVPTALYIERMEFSDTYNVNIGGQLWQKYPLDIVDDIETGVRFPQISPFAESALLEEAYREDIQGKEGEAGYRLIGYDFRFTLLLDLSYRDFPFDKRKLDIQIAPQSHTDNLLFVPDLTSFQDTKPSAHPGLSPQIKLPGSQIVNSYFNLSYEDFGTDFGFSGQSQYQHVPMLHFNIDLKRSLLTAFVTYLIPIVVTIAMIFILLIASEKQSERQGIIESMAAFIFVLVFSQIDLRKDIVTADLLFIEYFYFITYFMIILSTFNLITFTRSKVAWFDWNDNLIYRSLYFPIVFGLVLIAMIAQFY